MIPAVTLCGFGLLPKTKKFITIGSLSPHFLSSAFREFYHQLVLANLTSNICLWLAFSLIFDCLQLLKWLRSLGIIHCQNWNIYILKQNNFQRMKWGSFTLFFHEICTSEFVHLFFLLSVCVCLDAYR